MWVNSLTPNTKTFKYNFKKKKKTGLNLNHGVIGLKAIETKFLKFSELKALDFFLKKNLKKKGKVFLNFVPNFAMTKKPLETRMGKGKGNFSEAFSFINQGRIFVEIYSNLNLIKLNKLLDQGKKKLSIKCKIITFKL